MNTIVIYISANQSNETILQWINDNPLGFNKSDTNLIFLHVIRGKKHKSSVIQLLTKYKDQFVDLSWNSLGTKLLLDEKTNGDHTIGIWTQKFKPTLLVIGDRKKSNIHHHCQCPIAFIRNRQFRINTLTISNNNQFVAKWVADNVNLSVESRTYLFGWTNENNHEKGKIHQLLKSSIPPSPRNLGHVQTALAFYNSPNLPNTISAIVGFCKLYPCDMLILTSSDLNVCDSCLSNVKCNIILYKDENEIQTEAQIENEVDDLNKFLIDHKNTSEIE